MFPNVCQISLSSCKMKDVLCAINNYTLYACKDILSYVIGIMTEKLPKINSFLIGIWSNHGVVQARVKNAILRKWLRHQ